MCQEYNEVAYSTWFRNTKPISYSKETDELVTAVKNPTAKGYWEANLSAKLIQAVHAYGNSEVLSIFEVDGGEPTERFKAPQPPKKVPGHSVSPVKDDFVAKNS